MEITEKIKQAFINGESKKLGDTRTDGQSIKLQGVTIAQKDQAAGGMLFTLHGFKTLAITKRLKAAGIHVTRKHGKYYLYYIEKLTNRKTLVYHPLWHRYYATEKCKYVYPLQNFEVYRLNSEGDISVHGGINIPLP